MRVWLELNHEEGEKLFAAVKEFTVERRQTAVVSNKKKDQVDQVDQVKKTEEKNQEKPEKTVSIEEIRGILAEKFQLGKQLEVRELITRYGASKLTEIDPLCYQDLLKDAEEL